MIFKNQIDNKIVAGTYYKLNTKGYNYNLININWIIIVYITFNSYKVRHRSY